MRQSGKRGDPHGWNSLYQYIQIHYKRLDDAAWFIARDELGEPRSAGSLIEFSGELICRYGLVIAVQKHLERHPENPQQVRTLYYSYHVMIKLPDDTSRDLFRYDNAPHPTMHNELDSHHRHSFDPQTGREYDSSPTWIGAARWPHLSDVIHEAHQWWIEHGDEIRNETNDHEIYRDAYWDNLSR